MFAIANAIHREAVRWADLATTAGDSVTTRQAKALSEFCRAADRPSPSGFRSCFVRLQLFCGRTLTGALIPLYRSTAYGGTLLGNATDTNANFVGADYSLASGLWPGATNTTKYLDTGVPGNTFTGANHHHGYGLLATQTGSAAFRNLGGVFNGSSLAYDVAVRRNDTLLTARFGGLTTTFNAGEAIQSSSLAVGNIVASYPSVYRNGSAVGTNATASSNYSATTPWFIFALNNNGTAINHTNARLGWYSIGTTMTATQAAAFHAAIQNFYTMIGRS